jgi:hypothetical protein
MGMHSWIRVLMKRPNIETGVKRGSFINVASWGKWVGSALDKGRVGKKRLASRVKMSWHVLPETRRASIFEAL